MKSVLVILVCILLASAFAIPTTIVTDVTKPSMCPGIKSKMMCVIAGQVCLVGVKRKRKKNIWEHGKCIANPFTYEQQVEEPTTQDVEEDLIGNNDWACNTLNTQLKCDTLGVLGGHCFWYDDCGLQRDVHKYLRG
ncbi:hypothetical protein DFA_08079 [Cavenderia fasciculata]|uniref:Uncharacterized protein n=1 Tax=Cavenderia fasciculata TaxID=261658 RepID=F4Q4Z1_CACFS|nr:uncharacterized protein DFA_08079 [Cavenderia fasciculata]EGG17097.1 hypothetical protein DFA_08079 [Cavenderia fasciculata]|eukprot:XP_004355581.1 hypothetical protein DFA_08079 [Cavenderia fasciculata]